MIESCMRPERHIRACGQPACIMASMAWTDSDGYKDFQKVARRPTFQVLGGVVFALCAIRFAMRGMWFFFALGMAFVLTASWNLLKIWRSERH